MEGKPITVDVTINLNWNEYPEETQLIYNIIKAGNLGSLLYVTVSDIVSGKYDMQDSQTQSLLDSVISTVTSIYHAMSGIDENVLDLVSVVNSQSDIYKQLSERMESVSASSDLDIEPIQPITIQPEDIGLDTGTDEDGLDVEDVGDLFIL